MRRHAHRLIALAALALCAAPPAEAEPERVALLPARAPAFHLRRAIESLRSDARAPRELAIETQPAGARLELAYLRRGAQLAHGSGSAPLAAQLPGRALCEEDDRIRVSAHAEGYAPAERELPARELAPRLRIVLDPLPRELLGATLLELGDYARLELSSDRALDARLAQRAGGVRLVIANVVPSAEAEAQLAALRGETLARASARRLGEDWVVELETSAAPPRLLRRAAPPRSPSRLALEWMARDGRARARDSAGRVLQELGARELGPCGVAFEDALVAGVGAASLARELAPSGGVVDEYVELAIRRVATLAPRDTLTLRDGSRLPLETPLARRAAALRAGEVRGVLVAIRELAHALAPAGSATQTLRAWLAPELDPVEFNALLTRARDAEQRCVASLPAR